MRKILRKILPIAAVLALMPVMAQAQNRFALVVGNAKYQRIAELRNTINDAQDIATSLRSLGFQVDLQLDVTHLQMVKAMDAFVSNLKRNRSNEGFFWYAGHAVQIQEENYLLPIDVTADSANLVRATSYSLSSILKEIEVARNKVNVIVLDACRNNPLPPEGQRTAGGERGLSVIHDVPSDLFVMFSTQPGNTADDGLGKRNSPFAEAFLKYMKSTEPLVLMAADVTNETLSLTNNKQRPFNRGSIISEKYYSLNSAKTPVVATPAAPRNVRAGTPGTDKVTLSWDSAGSGIRYKVYYNSANDPARASALGTLSDGTTTTIPNLKSGTDYYFWVASVQNGVESAKSPVVPVKTAAAVPVNPPAPNTMVRIQGGTFTMGSPASEAERSSSEVQHTVTVSSFYLGKYEVTQKEYRELMGNNPSYFKGDNLPVENVSWYDAVEYCNARSRKEGLTPAYTISGSGDNRTVTWNRSANGYRLPTEAEWEYACRAGTTTPFSTGNNITTNQANYDGNYPYSNNAKGTYREKTTPVGSFAPNSWGLYDMHGNVWEWCWDWYGSYSSGSQTDPMGASSGSYRVIRGGSWDGNGQYLRSAYRLLYNPSDRYYYLGFRVLRP